MLSKIKLWLYGAALAASVAFATWLYRKGAADQVNKETRRRIDAMQDAKDIRHEVQNSDDSRLVDILSGRVRK